MKKYTYTKVYSYNIKPTDILTTAFAYDIENIPELMHLVTNKDGKLYIDNIEIDPTKYEFSQLFFVDANNHMIASTDKKVYPNLPTASIQFLYKYITKCNEYDPIMDADILTENGQIAVNEKGEVSIKAPKKRFNRTQLKQNIHDAILKYIDQKPTNLESWINDLVM